MTLWAIERRHIAVRALVLCLALLLAVSIEFGWGIASSIDAAPLAYAAAYVLELLGVPVVLDGAIVVVGEFTAIVTPECAAVGLTLLYCAAVGVTPASWQARLWGIALGSLALAALNFVRIVSLLLIGMRYPDYVDLAHTAMWQGVMVAAALGIWWIWLRRAARTA